MHLLRAIRMESGIVGKIYLNKEVCMEQYTVTGMSCAACAARDPQPSHVLLSMGYSEQLARQSVRISVGRMTTGEEISKTIQAVKCIWSKER